MGLSHSREQPGFGKACFWTPDLACQVLPVFAAFSLSAICKEKRDLEREGDEEEEEEERATDRQTDRGVSKIHFRSVPVF